MRKYVEKRSKKGSLLKRGRTYYARVIVEGRIITRSLGTGDRREAEAKFREFISPYQMGTREAALSGVKAKLADVADEIRAYRDSLPALAVADMWDAYEACAGRPDTGEATLSRYRAHVRDLAGWLAANRPDIREVRQIAKGDAEAFLGDLRKKRSAGTYNKHVVFFRHLWKTLSDADDGKLATARRPQDRPAKIESNPWERVRKIAGESHTRRELTVDELRRVCETSAGEMRLLFALGIYTGLRLGDCALLEWGSVDLVRRIISLVPMKTKRSAHGKPTVVPIHPTLHAMLAEIPQGERQGAVLPQAAEMYARDSAALSKRIQRHFEANGIRTVTKPQEGRAQVDVGFHSLRHTFVSLSANAGAPLAVVQALVGHASPAMTRHYFHESEAALRGVVAALPDISEVGADKGAEEAPDSLASFKAAYLALSPTDRRKAREWMEGGAKRRVRSNVP